MLMLYFASIIIGLVMLCVFLSMRTKKSSAQATVAKAVTSVFFILTWIFASAEKVSLLTGKNLSFAALLGGGLVCGLLGDIWLDLKFVYRKDEKFYTYAGFLSFAAGHFFFIAAIATGVNGKFNFLALLCALAVAVIVALVIFFGEKAMKLNYGTYKKISVFYGALLFFMTAFAFFTALFAGLSANLHLVVMAVGGVFFAVSDLILSGTYFGKGKSRPVDIVTNHVTYYAAQFIIASCVLLIKVIRITY